MVPFCKETWNHNLHKSVYNDLQLQKNQGFWCFKGFSETQDKNVLIIVCLE